MAIDPEILVQTNFCAGDYAERPEQGSRRNFWVSAIWIPHASNLYADKALALSKLDSISREVDFISRPFDAKTIEESLETFVLNAISKLDLSESDKINDSDSRINTDFRSFDIKNLQVIIHNSPPEWIELIKLLRDSMLITGEVGGVNYTENLKAYSFLIGLSALGLIVIGAARGIATGLQQGLHERILESLRRRDD